MRRVAEQGDGAVTAAAFRVVAPQGQGRPSVLELAGDFDVDVVPEIDGFLRRTLGPLYHQDHLVIDLARTTFIDSSFIAFLVRLSAAQRAKRRELLLVRPRGQVRRLLCLVGLPNVVPVFETVEAAMDVLAGRLPVIPPAVCAVEAC